MIYPSAVNWLKASFLSNVRKGPVIGEMWHTPPERSLLKDRVIKL